MSRDTITVTAPVSYKTFMVPNFAGLAMRPRPKQDGMTELPSIPLSEVPAEALHKLVDAWVDEVYRKAGKERQAMTGCDCALPR